MSKKSKKGPKRKNNHPTLFVFDGSIRYYPNGSMLELHTAVTEEEWGLITEETVKYKIFLECLKEVAYPALDEKWTKEDDWFRLQLEIATSRIRNIDPMAMIRWQEKAIKEEYVKKMLDGSKQMIDLIKEMRKQQSDTILQVSNL